MNDYCQHRLLVVGPLCDLKTLDRDVDWKKLADAKDIALVDRSAGRRLWQFVTPAPALQSIRILSRQWPRLTFFLHYDCEDARIIGLIRAKNGRLSHHRFRYYPSTHHPIGGRMRRCACPAPQVETPTRRLCVERTLKRPNLITKPTTKKGNMKKITVQYGVDSITKQVEVDFTFGDLQESDAFKGALGFGDNTKALVDGIEQDRRTAIPDGATVRLETAANTKA